MTYMLLVPSRLLVNAMVPGEPATTTELTCTGATGMSARSQPAKKTVAASHALTPTIVVRLRMIAPCRVCRARPMAQDRNQKMQESDRCVAALPHRVAHALQLHSAL